MLHTIFDIYADPKTGRVSLEDLDDRHQSVEMGATMYSQKLANMIHAFGLTRVADKQNNGAGRGFLEREVEQMIHEFITWNEDSPEMQNRRRASKGCGDLIKRVSFNDLMLLVSKDPYIMNKWKTYSDQARLTRDRERKAATAAGMAVPRKSENV